MTDFYPRKPWDHKDISSMENMDPDTFLLMLINSLSD